MTNRDEEIVIEYFPTQAELSNVIGKTISERLEHYGMDHEALKIELKIVTDNVYSVQDIERWIEGKQAPSLHTFFALTQILVIGDLDFT